MSDTSKIDEFIAELEEAEEIDTVGAAMQLSEGLFKVLLPAYIVVVAVIALLSRESFLFTFAAVLLVGGFVAGLYFGSVFLIGGVIAATEKLRAWFGWSPPTQSGD
jgi:hypothetical protein